MANKESLALELECTMLFEANPYLIETARGLESRLGRKSEDLEPVLELLVKQGILQKVGAGPSAVFRYQEPTTHSEFDFTSELEPI